jgi:hypothetical protein
MEINVGKKTKVTGTSNQSPHTGYDRSKTVIPTNMEYYQYFGSMIINYARCTREIRSRNSHGIKQEDFSPANCT